jgi:hypothetical protein
MYDMDLGDGPPNTEPPSTHYLELGYDIDHRCTTPANKTMREGAECNLPTFSSGLADGTQGQDNALGKNIQFIRDRIQNFSSAVYSEGLKVGQSANLLINVTGYNGEANDDQVRVETMVAADFDALTGDGAVPKWDGTDVWPIASDSVNGDRDHPKFVADLAYVTDYRLVVSLPEGSLRLIASLTNTGKKEDRSKLAVVMRAAIVSCVITATDVGDYGYELRDCRLSARWLVDDIIHQLSQFPDPIDLTNPKPLCTDANTYALFKDSLCGVVDTYSQTSADTSTCNSLSVGLGFNAKPGRLGNVFDVAPIAPRCTGANGVVLATDPINDSCWNTGVGRGGGTGA